MMREESCDRNVGLRMTEDLDLEARNTIGGLQLHRYCCNQSENSMNVAYIGERPRNTPVKYENCVP